MNKVVKPKALTQEQIDFLQLYYKIRGRAWCAIQLGMAENTLRYKMQLWRDEHGEMEFIEPLPRREMPRRICGPIPKRRHNSCRRWLGYPTHGRSQPMISGRRIA